VLITGYSWGEEGGIGKEGLDMPVSMATAVKGLELHPCSRGNLS